MIKMLISSFYNTLINEEEAIPTSTMLEIDRIRQEKIKFTVLTNRLAEDVLYYNQDYPFIDYIIALNGSIVIDLEKNKMTHFASFTKKECSEIEKKYKEYEIKYYTEDSCEESIPQKSVYKIEIKVPKKDLKTISVEEKYHSCLFQMNKETILELTKNTPYEALKQILKEHKIKSDEIIGIIGNDSEKDLLKLKNIYVVRNASKDLKEITTNLTKTNKSKGVENIIKREIK